MPLTGAYLAPIMPCSDTGSLLLPACSAVHDPEEKVGELDRLRGLDRVVELDRAVAGGVLEHAHGAGEQVCGGLPFPALGSEVRQRTVSRAERFPHEAHPDELVGELRDAPHLDLDRFHGREARGLVVAKAEVRASGG